MSILTNTRGMKHKIFHHNTLLVVLALLAAVNLQSCKMPDEEIVLRDIKDVVADVSTDPTLKGTAIFYNPNNMRGRLKHISVDIYVNGKKAGKVKKDYKIAIPRRGEFTVPIEVELNIKELGLFDTILGMVGGKKFEIRYDGYLRLNYRGLPIRVPIDYKDEVRLRL
jgi:LEA14-like dessication related protein